jgi:hypothetical protein
LGVLWLRLPWTSAAESCPVGGALFGFSVKLHAKNPFFFLAPPSESPVTDPVPGRLIPSPQTGLFFSTMKSPTYVSIPWMSSVYVLICFFLLSSVCDAQVLLLLARIARS